jgi:hypothetical protein
MAILRPTAWFWHGLASRKAGVSRGWSGERYVPRGTKFLPLVALAWLAVTLALLALHAPARAQQPPREYQVKAVFLFNFVQFTEWPPEAFTNKEQPYILGVLGNNPFGNFLADTVKNETVRGRPLIVAHYKTVEEIESCHILYLGQSEAPRLDRVLSKLKGRPVLSVTDIEKATVQGACIEFFTDRNRIRLRINPDAAKAANLTISSKLLRLGNAMNSSK